MSESEEQKMPHPARRKRKRPSENDVGDALRSVYDRALREEIPPDLLDLLGKLG